MEIITTILLQLFTGFNSGMNLFLVSSGLSLIFGVLRVINFTHGSIFLLSAYLCYLFSTIYSFWIGLLVAPIIAAIIGSLIELLLIKKIYKNEHIYQLILTWGLVLVFSDIFKFIWGVDKKTIKIPEFLNKSFLIINQYIPYTHIFNCIISLIIAILLIIFVYKTKIGIIIRASASDSEITETLGVNTRLIYNLVFSLACWLAGIGGALYGLLNPIQLGVDLEIVSLAFIIVIIGGMGSILGAFIGSIIAGIINAIGILILPRFVMVFIYALMIIILLTKPSGLYGKTIERV